MTIKRFFLILLTILAIAKLGLSLVESFNQPQIQSRLELYQTNLVLQATELQSPDSQQKSTPDLTAVRNALIDDDPYLTAQKQYQEAREVAQKSISNYQAKLQQISSGEPVSTKSAKPDPSLPPVEAPDLSSPQQQLQQVIDEGNNFIAEINLKIGILQAQRGERDAAEITWNKIIQPIETGNVLESISQTAAVLAGLWNDPPRISPTAQSQIQENLDGWFRDRALTQLYSLQQRQEALLTLQSEEQVAAQQALVKLTFIGAIPALGGIIGVGLLLFLIAQLVIKGKESLLALTPNAVWETPWDWEIVWQVLIVGFFFIAQILLPLLIGLSGFNPTSLSIRGKAFYVLFSYLLMAASGLLVLYFSVKSFFPLPKDWFRFKLFGNWVLWGLGGYLVAVPLVVIVSLINQQIWEGQGGSNPILYLALQAQDQVALVIFFLTASVAAPVFEEIMFRGFLLPSLTRYLPAWGAIVTSGFIFSIAHLSLSEVLPLATLGIVLGFVYTRSRNLLSSIFLHSLWNSGTLLSLFILGS